MRSQSRFRKTIIASLFVIVTAVVMLPHLPATKAYAQSQAPLGAEEVDAISPWAGLLDFLSSLTVAAADWTGIGGLIVMVSVVAAVLLFARAEANR